MKFTWQNIFTIYVSSFATAACVLAPTHVLHESRDASPRWSRGARLPENLILPVKIGLVQSNVDRGHDLLMDISDPDSKNYARHRTAEELDRFFAPSEKDRNTVLSWLQSEGITNVTLTANKEWIHFRTPAKKAESLFHTEYYEFTDKISGKTRAACDRYHLPHEIHPLVDYIKPGIHPVGRVPGKGKKATRGKRSPRPRPRSMPWSARSVEPHFHNCSNHVTPTCYRERYNITDTLVPQEGNVMGIYEDELDFLNVIGLRKFFRAFAPEIPDDTFPEVIRIDGAPAVRSKANQAHRAGDEGESDLDFQVSYPLVYPDKLILYQVDDYHYEVVEDNTELGEFNTMLDAFDGSYCHREAFGIKGDDKKDPKYPSTKGPHPWDHKEMCGRFKPPQVLSISYGSDEDNYPTNYARRQCTEYMKLALQGTTIVYATGDDGVSPSQSDRCEGPEHEGFGPPDTANCPYILGVGSTLLQSLTGPFAEVASKSFGSTGGFSNIYPRPAYQNESLNYYFENHDPKYKYYMQQYHNKPIHNGRYNRAGRGMPDVSAIGQHVAMYLNHKLAPGSGTSAAAPLWGALLTRINNARKAAGKGSVGFVNQVLYKHPELMNDVIKGNNPGCKTPGFHAVKGWDPVTGLGTPNYGRLKEFFMGLP